MRVATFARQMWSVALAEWRVAWRGLGLRLALLLVALPFTALNLVRGHTITPWTDDGGLGILTFTAPFAALAASFVVVPSSHRERMLRVADLVWVRPLNGAAYLGGKLLGASLVMGAILAEITGLVALYQITGGGVTGAPLLVGALLGVAPALLLAAALCVACGELLPHPLLGYLVVLVYCSFFGFFMTQSMVLLWNPWAQSLSYNRFLGFALDLPLLLTDRLFYAGLLLAALGAVSLLFVLRERRALRPRRQGLGALASLALGVVVVVVAVPRFDAAVATVIPSGPIAPPPPVALAIRDYRLDLRVDPATGMVQGTADFLADNDGATLVAALPLYLNDGLRIGVARVDGHGAAVRDATLFSTLMLAHPLVPGGRATVHVAYAGRYKLLRAQYANDRLGMLGAPSEMMPELHPSLVGAGLAVLARDGDWYPRPWTRSATTWSPAPLGWHALRIRVPGGTTVLAATADLQRQGDEQVATWAPAGQLPTALLAALPQGYTRLLVPAGAIYAPAWDAHELPDRYGPYVAALRDLTAFFGRPARPVAIVVVPSARGSGVVGGVALGPGLALVPVDALERTPQGTEADVDVVSLAPPALYRAALSDLAVAWWADHLPVRVLPTTSRPGPALPTGYVDAADDRLSMGMDRSGMLAAYTGAATAEQHLGPAVYAREMALRRAVASLALRDPNGQSSLARGEGPLVAGIRALGLWDRIDGFDASPALDDLRRGIGPEQVRGFLIALANAGRTPADPTSVTCVLSRAMGRAVAPLVRRYLGPFGLYGLARGEC